MALLNRRLKDRDIERFPLVGENDGNLSEYGDETDLDTEANEQFQHHGISLWLSDSVLMLIEHIQIFAVFLVLSEKWSWPLDWIRETSFVLLINLDIWEFWKINKDIYDGASEAHVPSSNMFSYKTYLVIWTVFTFVFCTGFVAMYRYLIYKRPLYLLLYLTRMKRVLSVVAQVVCIPIGLVVVRLLQCRPEVTASRAPSLEQMEKVLNVENNIKCWSGSHLIYGLETLGWFLLLIAALLFLVYPVYLWRVTKGEVFTHSSTQHEGYLQLKEAEYLKGLDIVWAVEQFFLFSSYRRPWVYYQSVMYFLRFSVIFAYGISLDYQVYPMAIVTITMFLLALLMMVVKPFRVNAFNVMKIVSLLCNSLNALIGLLLELEVESAILIYPNIKYALLGINSFAILAFVVFFSFLVLRHYGVIRKKRPLWPALSKDEKSQELDSDTKRYLRAVLQGRQVLERALSTPPIFAPVHELERQIQIINAYCREAEVTGNQTFDTLWDLLDELIEAHNVFNSQSLFSQSNKTTVQDTANELMKIMPAFRKRMDKREYDFILMNPVKRRMLLKLYALGLFLNGRSTKAQENVTKKLRFDKMAKRSVAYDWKGSSIGSPLYSNSDSASVPNTAGTLDKLTDSVDDLLKHVDSVTNNNNDGPQILVVQHEKNVSNSSDGSSISLPGAVAYEENNDITQIV
ncbi:Hypothetical predicted protein [Paramuricea clavata]|uniref:Uncharacterized protein n=1 Tax=Paramuricea clavata TaxID=317549 RepID=A0A7D9HD40_PARCT|nr:Hypothetical predicted protein [Paramuricea clavata]